MLLHCAIKDVCKVTGARSIVQANEKNFWDLIFIQILDSCLQFLQPLIFLIMGHHAV